MTLLGLVTMTSLPSLLRNEKKRRIQINTARGDGWMSFDFTSITTVFPSYDADGRAIKIGCVQCTPVYSPTESQRSWVRYPVWPHTFVSPSADSRGAVVSYWRKYVHEVLVSRLGGLSLPRKSVVRLTDRPDMTLDVYRGRKTPTQQPTGDR